MLAGRVGTLRSARLPRHMAVELEKELTQFEAQERAAALEFAPWNPLEG